MEFNFDSINARIKEVAESDVLVAQKKIQNSILMGNISAKVLTCTNKANQIAGVLVAGLNLGKNVNKAKFLEALTEIRDKINVAIDEIKAMED
jgi:hypothetical protein